MKLFRSVLVFVLLTLCSSSVYAQNILGKGEQYFTGALIKANGVKQLIIGDIISEPTSLVEYSGIKGKIELLWAGKGKAIEGKVLWVSEYESVTVDLKKVDFRLGQGLKNLEDFLHAEGNNIYTEYFTDETDFFPSHMLILDKKRESLFAIKDYVNKLPLYISTLATDIPIFAKGTDSEDMLKNMQNAARGIFDIYEKGKSIKPELKSDAYKRLKSFLLLSIMDKEFPLNMVRPAKEFYQRAEELINKFNHDSKAIYSTATLRSAVLASGYKTILEDIKKADIDGSTDIFKKAVNNSPEIYSIANVTDLLRAAMNSKNIAEAKDFVSIALAIIKNMPSSEQVQELETEANKTLTTRLYKAFINNAVQNRTPKLCSYDSIKAAMDSEYQPFVEQTAQDILYSAMVSFTMELNGKISTATQSAVVFGTPANEYKDGLLYLMRHYNSNEDLLLKDINNYEKILNILLLCNNDKIISSDRKVYSVMDFYTQIFAINDRNIILENDIFGSLDQNDFKQEDITSTGKMILNKVDADKLDKGLKIFNEINKIIKK